MSHDAPLAVIPNPSLNKAMAGMGKANNRSSVQPRENRRTTRASTGLDKSTPENSMPNTPLLNVKGNPGAAPDASLAGSAHDPSVAKKKAPGKKRSRISAAGVAKNSRNTRKAKATGQVEGRNHDGAEAKSNGRSILESKAKRGTNRIQKAVNSTSKKKVSFGGMSHPTRTPNLQVCIKTNERISIHVEVQYPTAEPVKFRPNLGVSRVPGETRYLYCVKNNVGVSDGTSRSQQIKIRVLLHVPVEEELCAFDTWCWFPAKGTTANLFVQGRNLKWETTKQA